MTAEAISTAQRNRLALVYIRQSSPQQVARNLESQRRQRAFVNRAVELGWAANRIRVIDEDLGQSGARSGNRQGFQQMVAMAALGRIGIILAGGVTAGSQQRRLVPTAGRLCGRGYPHSR